MHPRPGTLKIIFRRNVVHILTLLNRNHNISLEIDGHNQQIIADGAIVDISMMKRGSDNIWRHFASQRYDLCVGLKAIFGEACPVRSGVSTETRNFTLPEGTPSGDYYVVIDAHTKFLERITCMQATVSL